MAVQLLPILQGIAYAMTAAAAASSMANKPTNQLSESGTPAGGGTMPQAQDIFAQNQMARMAPPPPSVTAPYDPNVQAQANSLATGQMPPITSVPQEGPNIQSGVDKISPPNSPAVQGANMGLGDVLSALGGVGGVSQALTAMAPYLGLGENVERPIMGSPAGGGGGGQPVFALPQRATLAQILANLPRTM